MFIVKSHAKMHAVFIMHFVASNVKNKDLMENFNTIKYNLIFFVKLMIHIKADFCTIVQRYSYNLASLKLATSQFDFPFIINNIE